MGDAIATATKRGDILLLFTDEIKQTRVELSIETAEELKAQIEAALVLARIRIKGTDPLWG
jgi:hypothetical protein